MTAAPTFFITTPIYYVNDRPHIGHAYTTIACDAIARFMRLDGRPVHFLTGTDEHGQKVEKSAKAAGVEPQVFCDEISQVFRDLVASLNVSNDDFIRTTEPRHIAACQAIWRELVKRGEIYLGKYAGWYCVRDEAFYAEDELSPPSDVDGVRYAPTGAPVAWVEEPSYFFRLSAWGDRLLEHYERHPNFIMPASRRNEVLQFVRSGLKDLSVSRTSFSWGVPVPDDPSHIMYVWLDALTNYVTALGYPDMSAPLFQQAWPAAAHVVGKDILRFHAVYWPAFLMAAGIEPPETVFAHGWWTVDNEKMSKSLGNAIDPLRLIADYGLDPVRYFLLREMPFGQDGGLSATVMVNRINADLANNFGNLAQRVLSQVQRNLEGRAPALAPSAPEDHTLLDAAYALLPAARQAMCSFELHTVLQSIWSVLDQANRYVDTAAPWTLKKTDPVRMSVVLGVLVEVIRITAILAQPVIPAAANAMLDQLSVPAARRQFSALSAEDAVAAGTKLPIPQGVFPRIAVT